MKSLDSITFKPLFAKMLCCFILHNCYGITYKNIASLTNIGSGNHLTLSYNKQITRILQDKTEFPFLPSKLPDFIQEVVADVNKELDINQQIA
jgi:hypothetical protein